MNEALNKLIRIIELEAEHGYRNRAAIGGLERVALYWERDIAPQVSDERCRAAIAQLAALMRAYKALEDRAARQAHLEQIRKVVEQLAQLLPPGLPATPARPPRPQPVSKPQPTVQPQPRIAPSRATAAERLGVNAPVTALVGVSKAYADRFARLGVRTIYDLLYLFPRRYDDFSHLKLINQLEYGEEVSIIATVWQVNLRRTRSGAQIVQATLGDDSGVIQCSWFNQPYLMDKLTRGKQIVVSGRVEEYMGSLTFQHPAWEPLDKELLHTARLVPVYPLTEGITNRWLRTLMKRVVEYWAPRVADHLPPGVIQSAALAELSAALRQIHLPDNWDEVDRARRRLAFDELFLIQLGVLKQRHLWRAECGCPLTFDPKAVEQFIASLPYPLTGAQRRALDEILGDMRAAVPMNRLLQGDVGSGKTVVAAIAAWAAIQAGVQAALMAPTEILAEQHFKTLTKLFDVHGSTLNVRLLTGSTPDAEKERIYAGLADGTIHMVIGTHALIQPNVTFRRLALVIVDEQHRFGVQQRGALRRAGGEWLPHMLVMTATPIPRTLALTLYGDLDLSIIDELPPGRQKIETHWLFPTERERAYNFIRAQVSKGHQAFIICPLVQESEKLKARELEVKAAVEEYERLKTEVFPRLRLGLLHGRMKSEEKEATMSQFARGELDILVSTSVVEVGIDVPNATVMLVEGANRFGLAQLHQFRGRVGRGSAPAYCLLLADSTNVAGDERLRAIETIHDGFRLAEKDLELRGPGEFLGTRQSGLPDVRMAKLTDASLLEQARRLADQVLKADPALQLPENCLLAERIARFWSGNGDIS